MFWFWFVLVSAITWVVSGQPTPAKNGQEAKPAPGAATRAVTVVLMSPISALLALGLVSCTGGGSSASESGELTESRALLMCQEAIKRTMLDPSSANVPYVENMGTAGSFYFAWGASTKVIRARNRLGLDAPVSASCSVDPATKAISQLSINGQTVR